MAGTGIGQVPAVERGESAESEGMLAYHIIGHGSELFQVNYDGALSVACPTSAPCLDRERDPVYHLLVYAVDQSSHPMPQHRLPSLT